MTPAHGNDTSADAGIPLSTLLDEQGRVELSPDQQASVDVSGYRMELGPDQAPRFVPDSATAGADWSSFGGVRTGCNGRIFALHRLNDGRIVAAGRFSICGNVQANNVAIWNGSAWSTLGSGINNGVYPGLATSVTSIGSSIYVGGIFANAGGQTVSNIARFNAGSWSSLAGGVSTGSNQAVRALAASGSTLYVGGEFAQAGTVTVNSVASWNGSTWSALGSGVSTGTATIASVSAIAIDGSQVIVGGRFAQAGGNAASNIASWNGSAWSPLGSGIVGTVNAIAKLGSEIFAGGSFTQLGDGRQAFRAARWNGTTWNLLGASGSNGVIGTDISALVVDGTSMVIGGRFTGGIYNPVTGFAPGFGILRWTGSAFQSIGAGVGGGPGTAYAVDAMVKSGNDLIVAGSFGEAEGSGASNIVIRRGTQWVPLDSGSGNGANGSIAAAAVSGGNLYIGGRFSTVGTTAANLVARWNGSQWSSLGSGAENGLRTVDPFIAGGTLNASVDSIAVVGSSVYVAGFFNRAGSVDVRKIAKWDGSAWSAMGGGVNGATGDFVSALAASAGTLYAVGRFASIGGAAANNIAGWNGSSWQALGSGTNASIAAVAARGPNVYVGGTFNSAGGVSAAYAARWNGTAWSALGSGFTFFNAVAAIAAGPGEVFFSGTFTQAGGVNAKNIARWANGSWSALGSGVQPATSGFGVNQLLINGSDLYVGNLATAGGQPVNALGRWDGSGWSNAGAGLRAPNGAFSGVEISALATYQGDLLATGNFIEASSLTAAGIATKRELSDLIFKNGFDPGSP